MTWALWTSKEIAIIFVILALAGTATFFSIDLARPKLLIDTAMGDQWQCSKTADIVTVCTKKPGQAIARTPAALAGDIAAR